MSSKKAPAVDLGGRAREHGPVVRRQHAVDRDREYQGRRQRGCGGRPQLAAFWRRHRRLDLKLEHTQRESEARGCPIAHRPFDDRRLRVEGRTGVRGGGGGEHRRREGEARDGGTVAYRPLDDRRLRVGDARGRDGGRARGWWAQPAHEVFDRLSTLERVVGRAPTQG